MSRRFRLPKAVSHYGQEPTAGLPGDVFFDSTDEVFKKFDGSTWNSIGVTTGDLTSIQSTLTSDLTDFEIKVIMGVY